MTKPRGANAFAALCMLVFLWAMDRFSGRPILPHDFWPIAAGVFALQAIWWGARLDRLDRQKGREEPTP